MDIGVQIAQSQNQSLILTPQQQQSLKLLQATNIELKEEIERELLENPVLEIEEDGEKEKVQVSQEESESDKSKSITDEEVEIFDRLQSLPSGDIISDDELHYKDQPANKGPTLAEYLTDQLYELELEPNERALVLYLINNLNEKGYLALSATEIMSQLDCSSHHVDSALSLVQSLEPTGVGARNLAECLLLQLDKLGLSDRLEGRILRNDAELLEQGRINEIAFREGVQVRQIKDALENLKKLDPFPGHAFQNEKPEYSLPDISVQKVEEGYVTSLNTAGLPRLRVSPYYEGILCNKSSTVSEERRYVRGKMASATWLMRCIYQRERTILRVSTAIVDHQREFFDKGLQYLKPLALKEIAEKLGIHESTVSRAISHKYMDTPRGIFELKFFFTSGLKTKTGEISTSAVKDRIKYLIAHEERSTPIRDHRIVELLSEMKILIARRTVGKYRDALGIASASTRKLRYDLMNEDSTVALVANG